MGNFELEQLAARDGFNVVSGCPVTGDIFFVIIKLAGFDAFKRHHIVAVHIKLDFIEIIEAFLGGQVAPPIILHARKGDGTPGLYPRNFIWPAAKGRDEGSFVERYARIIMFRHYRHRCRNKRQFAVFAIGKIKPHLMRGDGHGLFNRLIKHAVYRVAFAFENVETEYDILGGDGFAVMPARFGVQEKIRIAAIRRNGDGLGNQRIVGLRLVVRWGHERLKHKIRYTRCRHTFQDIGIE